MRILNLRGRWCFDAGGDGSEVIFYAFEHLDADTVLQLKNEVKRRVMRAFSSEVCSTSMRRK